jgi:hypothetical protein
MGVYINIIDTDKFEVVEGKKQYGEMLLALDEIAFGVPYFLVTVNYDTGDTFGSREITDRVELFANAQLAAILMQKIKDHPQYSTSGKDWETIYKPIIYEVDDGTTRELRPFWVGYFEHLNGVRMEIVWRSK